MRSRLASCAVLLAVAASAVAAQQYTHTWRPLAPEGEEFAVHMPEPNFRIRRELPFGKGVTLKPASFEIAHRGVLFSVLSFSKSEPGAPKSLDAFIKGFGHAISAGGARADLRPAGEAQLDGRAARQLALRTDDGKGDARVFETGQHFYVVLTYGNAEAASASEHFHDSFTLDRAAAERLPLNETAQALTSPVKSPSPLWPVAGNNGSIVVLVGDRDATARDIGAPSSAPRPDLRGKTVISGGVLNGKVIAKPQPTYPPIAKAARAQGTVTVQILVDEEGYVIAANAVSGHPLLQQAAVFAARQARFSPTLLEGQPVKVSGVITYNFVLV